MWTILEALDPRELSSIPDVVIPSKFKMSKFEKYGGTKCLEFHLATYCHEMAGHAYHEKLLIHAGGIPRIAQFSKINI